MDGYPSPIAAPLNWLDFSVLSAQFLAFVPRLLVMAFIILFGYILARKISALVGRGLQRRTVRRQLSEVLVRITNWSIFLVAVTIALQTVGVNLTALIAGLGIVGFTLGFALQDVSKNFVAGLLLLLQQPFDIGDVIEVDRYIGAVQNVELRATEIRTFDGRTVLIPNADVYTSALINYSRNKTRRVQHEINIALKSDMERVRSVVLQALESVPGILSDPAPTVVFGSYAESSIKMIVYYWIDTAETNLDAARDGGLVAITNAFRQHNIEIPLPTRLYLTGTAADPAGPEA